MPRGRNNGTNLIKNPFLRALKSSIDNAGIICAYILATLYAARLTDTRILALYNYFLPLGTAVQDIIVALRSHTVEEIAATSEVELTDDQLQPIIHSIFLGIEMVYGKTTLEYKRLLIGGTKDFYGGSRNSKKTRLEALATAIGGDLSLAAVKLIVLDLIGTMTTGITHQTTEKFAVKTDSASVKTAVLDAARGVWYVYLGLMMVYILNPALAIAYLPMDFIYKAAKQTIKTVYVPHATIKKIMSHLFKVGETVTMKNNGLVDLYVGLAQTADSTVLVWYLLPAGQTVTGIAYNLLGNPAFKFIMVKNGDLTTAGDITFTVNGL